MRLGIPDFCRLKRTEMTARTAELILRLRARCGDGDRLGISTASASCANIATILGIPVRTIGVSACWPVRAFAIFENMQRTLVCAEQTRVVVKLGIFDWLRFIMFNVSAHAHLPSSSGGAS